MKSDEYWALRALQREAESHDGTADMLKRLAVMYGDADKELVRMIDRIFQNFRKYTGISEKEARELMSVQETAELLAELRKEYEETGDAETLAKLNAPAYGYRISRLQAVRRAIEAELDKLAGQEEKAGSRQLVKAYDDSYYKTTYDALPEFPGAPVVPLSQNVISQAIQNPWKGENYSSRVWKNRSVLASEGGKVIDAGVTAGKSIQQMTAELSDLMNIGAYAAARLIRTEVNRMHNDAALQSYKAMGVKEYTYIATLDMRTCSVCGALDLKVFEVAEAKTGVNLPPMHPNDRCTIAPKIPGANDGGSRTARDPGTGRNYRVPEDMTYSEWRKSISEKYGADSLEMAQKKYWNRKADAAQLKDLKKVLGKDAPKDLAELQQWKYNEPEKWKRIKGFYAYKQKYPSAGIEHYDIYHELQTLGISKGIVLPPEKVSSYILEDTKAKDPAHIMKRMSERHITDDDVHSYVNKALVMFDQWKGARKLFCSSEGATVVTKQGDDWIAKTAMSKFDFDEDAEKILEVIRKYVK